MLPDSPLGRCLAAALALLLLGGCATNPATGKKQLMLVGEGQEAAMGKEADDQFHELYGDFPDPAVQRYVESVARPLARRVQPRHRFGESHAHRSEAADSAAGRGHDGGDRGCRRERRDEGKEKREEEG